MRRLVAGELPDSLDEQRVPDLVERVAMASPFGPGLAV